MPPRINGSAARTSVRRAIERTTTSQSKSLAAERRILQNSTLGAASSTPRGYATATASGAGPIPQIPLGSLRLPDDYIPPTQPPSARRPETRKSQLLRSYTALLRSAPLMLFFQHNNLTAPEWAAIRRELRAALAQVPPLVVGPNGETPVDISPAIELQVLRTRIFDVALKITEFFDGGAQTDRSNAYTHDLSATAYETIKKAPVDDPTTIYAQIKPLMVGPVAAVTFPAVSPAHLAAVIKVLAPSPPQFPAPTRKKNPSYYEPTFQSGVQKLILIGSRIEGRVFDRDGVNWVGSIEGGLDGLRAQLVAMLQSAGLGLTTALESGSKALWLALEGRRTQLDEEANGGKKDVEQSG
ncbi:hypothetical protein DL767_010716 [Monosporascus sp. MG133]|nr:hypothetical protein DL767_010716 [Monosporascus sp. MG133]